MTIVKYSEAPDNALDPRTLASREGAVAAIELESGRIFDAGGNPIGKWDVADEDAHIRQKSSLCAGLLAQRQLEYAAYAMSTAVDFNDNAGAAHERAKTMLLNAWRTREDEAGHLFEHFFREGDRHALDLGVGDVHIPSALPNVAMGYRNEAPMADIYAAPVMVPKPTDFYWVFDKKDAYQRAKPTAGAPGGAVAEIAPRLSSTQFTTVERAVGGFVSTQLEAAADAPLRIVRATALRCQNAMLLEREIRVQSLARTTGNWNSGNVTALSAGFQWNGGASSDPIKDLHTAIEASVMEPSGIIMPQPVWNAFIRNPAVRAFYGFKDDGEYIPSASQFAGKSGLPPIFVSKMRYLDPTGAISFVWGTDVVLFRQPNEMPPSTQDDIASAYTFRWNMNGYQNVKDVMSASGGFIVRQYFVQDRGSLGGMKVVVVHQDAEVQTSGFVGALITGAKQ